jgi:hypothetical protein
VTAARPTTALTWAEFETVPVTVKQVQFTGFGYGNGWAVLDWLHQRDIQAVREGIDIRLVTEARDDAWLRVGWWLVDADVEGTAREAYPISPDVHAAKYREVQP